MGKLIATTQATAGYRPSRTGKWTDMVDALPKRFDSGVVLPTYRPAS